MAKKKGKAPAEKDSENTKAKDAKVIKKTAKPKETAGPPALDFPIVGIGASAGGLAAFEAFFSGMPKDSEPGMAFVLVQHLAPDHKSILTDLIRRYTRMQVFEVEDGMEVHPNAVYIIPPGKDMAFLNSSLSLLEPSSPRGLRMPIDFFFRSMAQDKREQAIGIILSGTGSDGTLGVRAIKGEGGMVMAQLPASTEYDGMPQSAIATGLVDYELPPAEMMAGIISYVTSAFGKLPIHTTTKLPKNENALKKIFIMLRSQTGHDFSQYKPNTILRRLNRRMAIHKIETMDSYIQYAQKTPEELEAFFRDLLIGVTNFFRDPEAFSAIEEKIIPRLFANKSADDVIRIWVPGCSTGEEAYSFAILLAEYQEEMRQSFNIQIFATDIDSEAITTARAGLYPSGIAADVSPERLARFFSLEPGESTYRIQKSLRDMLIFSEQSLTRDPPFSKLDLISCRNLLIYINTDLQRKLIPLFQYALNPTGVLFLGTSETVGEFSDIFVVLDKKQKIYQRRQDTSPVSLGKFLPPLLKEAPYPLAATKKLGVLKPSLRELTEQALLQEIAPTAVLVDKHGNILYLHGRTGMYLELTPGEVGVNILKMAREGLKLDLTTFLHKAVTHKKTVHCPGLKVKTNGDFTYVNLTICPVAPPSSQSIEAYLFLIILDKVAAPQATKDASTAIPEITDAACSDADNETQTLIISLRQELQAKEEYLQSTHEELETSNEELKSSNEEMQSVNEEMQSTNEELETSKEELQSVNEELSTVNAELQNKVTDLSRVNNDMNNLLAGTGIATVFVDHRLSILRFTPTATKIINLIQSDIGRPVGHLASNLKESDNLAEEIKAVLDTLIPREIEVQTKKGDWYIMNIQPYRTVNNVIEGAVLTFVNISQRKQAEEALLNAEFQMLEAIVSTVREPLLVLDADLRVILANASFYTFFQVKQDNTIGQLIYDLGNGQWDIPMLRELLENILPEKAVFNDYEMTHEFEEIGRHTMKLNARRMKGDANRSDLILLAMEDITGKTEKGNAS